MALLPADELVQFTFIEQVTTTTTTTGSPTPATTQTVGPVGNQQSVTMPGFPGIPEINTTTTDVQVIGWIYIRQIVSVTVHINADGNVQPGRSDVKLVDGSKKIIAAPATSVINDITA